MYVCINIDESCVIEASTTWDGEDDHHQDCSHHSHDHSHHSQGYIQGHSHDHSQVHSHEDNVSSMQSNLTNEILLNTSINQLIYILSYLPINQQNGLTLTTLLDDHPLHNTASAIFTSLLAFLDSFDHFMPFDVSKGLNESKSPRYEDIQSITSNNNNIIPNPVINVIVKVLACLQVLCERLPTCTSLERSIRRYIVILTHLSIIRSNDLPATNEEVHQDIAMEAKCILQHIVRTTSQYHVNSRRDDDLDDDVVTSPHESSNIVMDGEINEDISVESMDIIKDMIIPHFLSHLPINHDIYLESYKPSSSFTTLPSYASSKAMEILSSLCMCDRSIDRYIYRYILPLLCEHSLLPCYLLVEEPNDMTNKLLSLVVIEGVKGINDVLESVNNDETSSLDVLVNQYDVMIEPMFSLVDKLLL